MKLSVSDQYFQFLKSIDVDLDQLPESLRYQEDYQKEEFALSTLDYFHLLTANFRNELSEKHPNDDATVFCRFVVKKRLDGYQAFCNI